ncbi:hypothetical protein A2U01_0048689, partial [Trifolium medium]|nr:hypothetical protein [Trifolium medium]
MNGSERGFGFGLWKEEEERMRSRTAKLRRREENRDEKKGEGMVPQFKVVKTLGLNERLQ